MSELFVRHIVEAEARIAFLAGHQITDCPYPADSDRAAIWQAEYTLADAYIKLSIARSKKRAQASPQSHHAPMSGLRVDEAQPC